jgi:hypothetical protein
MQFLSAIGISRREVLLTATAQNLRPLAKLVCRPPPPLAGKRHHDPTTQL